MENDHDRHPLLLVVGWVLGGIQGDDQPRFVLPVQEGGGGSVESAIQGFYPPGITQDIIL